MKIQTTRIGDLLRITIGEHVYLASKRGVAIRDMLILHRPYSKVEMKDGSAIHLHFKGTFDIWGKPLEVEAISKLTFGPLGERMIFNVWYDGKIIGDYSALRSYMGGGSNGRWPFIKTDQGIVLFSFYSTKLGGDTNELIIESFKEIEPDPELSIETPIIKSIRAFSLLDGFIETQFTIEEIKGVAQTIWKVPVLKNNGVMAGILACKSFPGFNRYRKTYYGKIPNDFDWMEDRTFIDQSLDGNSLKAIIYQREGSEEVDFPWHPIDYVTDNL